MKTNAEIRKEARAVLKNGWLGRVMTVAFALYAIAAAVSFIILGAYRTMSVQTWGDFLQTKLRLAHDGLDCVLPAVSLGWSMTGATLFQQFIGYLFGAIVLLGLATVMLKAIRNDSERWFADSFSGFSRPFGVFGLIVLMHLRIFLWSLLFLIPGFVALYRYRAAWYLASERPSWGVRKCLSFSGVLMRGRKWRAFCLDLSFIGWMIFAYAVTMACGVGAIAVTGLSAAFGAVLSLVFCVAVLWLWGWLLCYFLMARAVFYREIAAETEWPAES